MRLVTYDRGGARRLGAWVGPTVVDLPQAVGHPAFPTTLESLVAHCGGTTLDAARDALDHPDYVEDCEVPDARLLAPILPISLLERRLVLGPGGTVPWPGWVDEVDYSVELACVLARPGRDLSEVQAERAIFGYTLLCDWEWRSWGRRGSGPMAGGFAASLGPCVVTADAFDPTHGRLVARVDGRIWSAGDLASARATFSELVAEVSRHCELLPGDVVASGTFPGGTARDLGRRLRPGAEVTVEAEGIGCLAARVGRPRGGQSRPRPLAQDTA